MKKNPPDLFDLLEQTKEDIFSTFNAVQIGAIEEVQKDKQTITAQIQVKRPTGPDSSEKYPVLVDVPFFILQGGTAYFDLPIKKGDFCIILFNDRCIDSWYKNGSISDAPKKRKHSLSDGLALVGINPSSAVRETDGNKTRIIAPDGLEIKGDKTEITAPDGLEINGNAKRLVTYAELDAAMQIFITALNLHIHTSADAGSPTSAPVTPMTIDISAAETSTIKTGG